MRLRVKTDAGKTNAGKTAVKTKSFLEMFSKKDGDEKKVYDLKPTKPSASKDSKDKKEKPSLEPKKPGKEKPKAYSLDLRARRKTKDGGK